MKKRDLKKFILDNIKDLPIEKQETIFLYIEFIWIPAILEKVIKNKNIDPSCGNYSPTKNFKKITMQKFEEFIFDNIKGLSPERQKDFLCEISLKWVPEIKSKLLKKYSKKYQKCNVCGKWFLKKDFGEAEQLVESKRDEDIFNKKSYKGKRKVFLPNITFLVKYYICPSCEHPTYKSHEISSIVYLINRKINRKI